ncbi:type II secretion system protein GspM [Pseudomonas sp. S75]|nr:type II secretion system protein GspM [Pseudomonas sp. S30]MBK0153921.1 type II secretion system protein GspM [Pseudomonas sp. S75]
MIGSLNRRQRLAAAWLLIGVLLSVLVGRELMAHWTQMRQWQGLAESAVRLQSSSPLGLEALRQSAQARGIALSQVTPQDGQWQVRGHVVDPQPLLLWLQALQVEGAVPLQWGLEQEGRRLRFDLWLRP